MRPRKRRKIGFSPNVYYYKPQGVPMRLLEEIDLTLEETEAVRLHDYKKMGQVEAAKKMGISQSTFARSLESAHKKIAKAIIEGKAIRIVGLE
jgi:predicted DNA-binding protein (UPF0251 family)